MTPRYVFSLTVILVVLTLQLVVPTFQLFADGPNRWGWQMFSRAPERPIVTVITADGEEATLSLDRVVLGRRYELRYDRQFAVQLCERELDATAILIYDQTAGETVQFQCAE